MTRENAQPITGFNGDPILPIDFTHKDTVAVRLNKELADERTHNTEDIKEIQS